MNNTFAESVEQALSEASDVESVARVWANASSGDKELSDCPFCGGLPTISELRYVNTGRIYGFWLKCAGCGVEIKEVPVCWPAGKENEEMLEARVALVTRWNRKPPSQH